MSQPTPFPHGWCFIEGQTYGNVLILNRLEAGPVQRLDRYAVQMTCCGTVLDMTHTQIRERQQRPPTSRCRHCLRGPDGVVQTWQPDTDLGPVRLLMQTDDMTWRIRWACCGLEAVLLRQRVMDILGKARRGEKPLCRICARQAAIDRYRKPSPVVVAAPRPPRPARPAPPPAEPVPQAPYLPAWLVSPGDIWPRPTSLPRQPTIWGTQW